MEGKTLMPLKFGKIGDRPKIWQNWRPTKNLPNFHHPNFYISIESHVNIEQIDWKIFLRHVPNNLQPGYHRSPLGSYGLWIM